MDVYGPGAALVVIAPYVAQEFFPGKDHAPVPQQEMAESSDNLEEFFIEKQRIKKQYI